MPKEKIGDGSFTAQVGWEKGEHNYHSVQLGIDADRKFSFVDDSNHEEYTGLWYQFTSAEQVDEFIKILHKAKRQTFK